ncbi:MAG: radical SAM family heme chaperone HemW [Lachnospiraceae bacterium]|nr:radical SAM family heme chaperone HemW [Lachnospiraceae bacterium]
MQGERTEAMELYIHIPFCVRKCNYCDFLSAPATGAEIDRYVSCLCREIRMSPEPDDVPIPAERVDTIFIGGGTPSLLTASQLKKIMEVVRENYEVAQDAEITIECNPGTVDLDKLKAIKELGINRLSIGLQATDNESLKCLGRIHDLNDFLETYANARKVGFDNINIDIMSAIPGQTVEAYRETLNKVIELKPEHISAYSLIIEENTPFYDIYGEDGELNGHPSLPSEDDERQMYYDTREMLSEAGYHRYEISNYAREGYECRHNNGYWTGRDYLGVGIGAASLIDGVRFSNVDSLKEYLAIYNPDRDYVEPYHVSIDKLSKSDREEEFMFLGLRRCEGVDRTDWMRRFGCDMDSVYGSVIAKLTEQGLLESEVDRLRLTDKGIDVSNIVLANFLQ